MERRNDDILENAVILGREIMKFICCFLRLQTEESYSIFIYLLLTNNLSSSVRGQEGEDKINKTLSRLY